LCPAPGLNLGDHLFEIMTDFITRGHRQCFGDRLSSVVELAAYQQSKCEVCDKTRIVWFERQRMATCRNTLVGESEIETFKQVFSCNIGVALLQPIRFGECLASAFRITERLVCLANDPISGPVCWIDANRLIQKFDTALKFFAGPLRVGRLR